MRQDGQKLVKGGEESQTKRRQRTGQTNVFKFKINDLFKRYITTVSADKETYTKQTNKSLHPISHQWIGN